MRRRVKNATAKLTRRVRNERASRSLEVMMRSATILFDYCREATTVTRAAPLGVHIDRPNDLCGLQHLTTRQHL